MRGLLPVTEPIFISTLAYGRGQGGRNRHGGEYLTFWYVGQIGEDAVRPSLKSAHDGTDSHPLCDARSIRLI